jgi:hypothetical protein
MIRRSVNSVLANEAHPVFREATINPHYNQYYGVSRNLKSAPVIPADQGNFSI